MKRVGPHLRRSYRVYTHFSSIDLTYCITKAVFFLIDLMECWGGQEILYRIHQWPVARFDKLARYSCYREYDLRNHSHRRHRKRYA